MWARKNCLELVSTGYFEPDIYDVSLKAGQSINWFSSKLKLIPWSRSFWLGWLKQIYAIFKGVIYICQLQFSQYLLCLALFLKHRTHLQPNTSTNPRAEKTKVLAILAIFRLLDNQLSSIERIWSFDWFCCFIKTALVLIIKAYQKMSFTLFGCSSWLSYNTKSNMPLGLFDCCTNNCHCRR